MSKFIALPVAMGDSFYFKRGDQTVLFDGGRYAHKLPPLFKKYTGSTHVDILVCSHNDSDHADGILGFLEDPGLTCNEVWLPGKWSRRLDFLLSDPIKFWEELKNIIEKDETGCRTLEEYAEFSEHTVREDLGPNELEDEVETDTLIANIDSRPVGGYLSVNNPQLHLDAIIAMENIKKIATAAINKNVKIRWFEFIDDQSINPRGGLQGLLVPVNSKELRKPKINKMNLLKYLYLSVVNRESLVFKAPPTNGNLDGVLFSADSNFAFHPPIPEDEMMLVTVPHHGADSAGEAYQRLNKKQSHLYVRSDCKSKKRPESSHKLLPKDRRWCTICARYSPQHSAVEFTLINSPNSVRFITSAANKYYWDSQNPICRCH